MTHLLRRLVATRRSSPSEIRRPGSVRGLRTIGLARAGSVAVARGETCESVGGRLPVALPRPPGCPAVPDRLAPIVEIDESEYTPTTYNDPDLTARPHQYVLARDHSPRRGTGGSPHAHSPALASLESVRSRALAHPRDRGNGNDRRGTRTDGWERLALVRFTGIAIIGRHGD